MEILIEKEEQSERESILEVKRNPAALGCDIDETPTTPFAIFAIHFSD